MCQWGAFWWLTDTFIKLLRLTVLNQDQAGAIYNTQASGSEKYFQKSHQASRIEGMFSPPQTKSAKAYFTSRLGVVYKECCLVYPTNNTVLRFQMHLKLKQILKLQKIHDRK